MECEGKAGWRELRRNHTVEADWVILFVEEGRMESRSHSSRRC